MRYYLVDNGSLRPAGYLNLCRVAEALGDAVGEEILPTSLLHSNRIPAEELGGKKALTWEPQMKADLEGGQREFCIIPFFFGPTGAILQYMPERLGTLREKFGDFHVEQTPFIFDGEGSGAFDLLEILVDRIDESITREQLRQPRVVFVDHGSPQPEVARARNFIAGQLSVRLRESVSGVIPASMERREGDAYRFTEPLLETVLKDAKQVSGDVVISQLFLSPGRHAGPDGDVTEICREAMTTRDDLRCHRTELVGTHPGIVSLLKNRFWAARRSLG